MNEVMQHAANCPANKEQNVKKNKSKSLILSNHRAKRATIIFKFENIFVSKATFYVKIQTLSLIFRGKKM